MSEVTILNPEQFKAKDGQIYPVLSFVEYGRGWRAKQGYTAGVGVELKPLRVKKLAIEEGKTWLCEILNPEDYADLELRRVEKRPYVRKDGSFNVVDPYQRAKSLNNIYGVVYCSKEYSNPTMVQRGWWDGEREAYFCYLSF